MDMAIMTIGQCCFYLTGRHDVGGVTAPLGWSRVESFQGERNMEDEESVRDRKMRLEVDVENKAKADKVVRYALRSMGL